MEFSLSLVGFWLMGRINWNLDQCGGVWGKLHIQADHHLLKCWYLHEDHMKIQGVTWIWGKSFLVHKLSEPTVANTKLNKVILVQQEGPNKPRTKHNQVWAQRYCREILWCKTKLIQKLQWWWILPSRNDCNTDDLSPAWFLSGRLCTIVAETVN
jgi:hypothetical protein